MNESMSYFRNWKRGDPRNPEIKRNQITITLRLLGMSWGVKTTCLEAPGVSLGGSGVSIGGVGSLREACRRRGIASRSWRSSSIFIARDLKIAYLRVWGRRCATKSWCTKNASLWNVNVLNVFNWNLIIDDISIFLKAFWLLLLKSCSWSQFLFWRCYVGTPSPKRT